MGLREDGRAGKLLPEDARLGKTSDSICSLKTAWLHALDKCVIDSPLSGVILPFLIGTGNRPFERAPQRRRCFDGEANSPHACDRERTAGRAATARPIGG